MKRCLRLTLPMVLLAVVAMPWPSAQADDGATLAAEVRDKGWLVFSARSDNGSWDLFWCRPDGSDLKNLTETPRYEEAAPRFSPDGTRLLYRRVERGVVLDHDKWGFMGTVCIANADASEPVQFGEDGQYPWANWMPDGQHLSCLYPAGIEIVSLESGEAVRKFSRKGIFQQLFPSPDGKWFCGTGNFSGEAWTIVRMDATTTETIAVQRYQSCTPDWFPDSERIIYSSRPAGQLAQEGYGATQLWLAYRDGTRQKFLYGDEDYHAYGGLVSPDNNYVVFTKSRVDGGGAEKDGAPMFLMRLADAPVVEGLSPELRAKYPDAGEDEVLSLPNAWEPHWTSHDVGATK